MRLRATIYGNSAPCWIMYKYHRIRFNKLFMCIFIVLSSIIFFKTQFFNIYLSRSPPCASSLRSRIFDVNIINSVILDFIFHLFWNNINYPCVELFLVSFSNDARWKLKKKVYFSEYNILYVYILKFIK